ncbi:MAG: hypothetical protein ACJAXK_002515 [Yoonia sp.]|jgi:hypothetical protein
MPPTARTVGGIVLLAMLVDCRFQILNGLVQNLFCLLEEIPMNEVCGAKVRKRNVI